MTVCRTVFISVIFILTTLAGSLFTIAYCYAEDCETVVRYLNAEIEPKVDATELVDILRTLNVTKNRTLPFKFISKKDATKAGWKPGTPLWSVNGLKGKSIGGDRFGNYEKKLPSGIHKWREADLDYQGGRRGSKRIVFSQVGLRMITVDHYKNFKEVPVCQ
jgi:ribonuclease T1